MPSMPSVTESSNSLVAPEAIAQTNRCSADARVHRNSHEVCGGGALKSRSPRRAGGEDLVSIRS